MLANKPIAKANQNKSTSVRGHRKRDETFPRRNRLTERPQFIRLFDKPGVYRAPTFQAFWKSNETGCARLGITIKGKLSSIWRTRIKRAIREWFRSNKEAVGCNDLNIVIRVPEALDLMFVDSLKQQLNRWKS